MMENDRALSTSPRSDLPPEFRNFREQTARISKGKTLDERVTYWATLLDAWTQHLENSTYSKQALSLLLPILTNFGNVCFLRYQKKGATEDLVQALELYQEAAQQTPPAAPDRLKRLDTLLSIETACYEYSQTLDDLDATIHTCKQIDKITANTPQNMRYQYLLGKLYKDRYLVSKEEHDLWLSMHSLQTVLDSEQAVDYTEAYYIQGLMYREHFTFTDDYEDLRKAADVWCQLLDLLQLEDPQVPEILMSIGLTFVELYEQTLSQEDLLEIITFWLDIIDRMPADSKAFSTCFTFLQHCFFVRYNALGELEDLEEAIYAAERAVEYAAPLSEEHARNLNNLGNIREKRYGVLHDSADLAHANACYEQSNEIMFNLAQTQ